MQQATLSSRTAFLVATVALLEVLCTAAVYAATVPCSPTLCAISANPCTVSGTVNITPGSEVDCTGRNVVVPSSAKIKVSDGFFKLIAASLDVQGSGSSQGVIEAVDGTGADPIGGFEIVTTGTATIGGSLQANSADGGGQITVDAVGNISIPNNGNNGVETNGTGPGGGGGRIALTSDGSILIEDPIQANSAGSGEAVGGQIDIDAGTSVTIQLSGCSVTAEGHQTDAGEIRINAGTDITIAAAVVLTADGNGEGGNGGGIYLTAGNKISLSAATSARGGKGAAGAESVGGTLQIESGCGGVDILGNLDLRGGEFGGGMDAGSLVVETRGNLTLGASKTIDTHAEGNGGSGGDVNLVAGRKILMGANSKIDARGNTSDPNADGLGASVVLRGCELEALGGATIDATGLTGGLIVLDAASPEGPQVTSMHLASTSRFDASGVDPESDGTIRVAVGLESLTGTCSTNGNPCTLDASCTTGCTPGSCDGLNPDTDGVLTQFLSTPSLREDHNLTGCDDSCVP